jgi:DNA-binding transcriptional ArsR family regulator
MNEKSIRLPHHHNMEENAVARHLPEDDVISDVSAKLKLLSDPTRLKIFWILCHVEECVINIAAMIHMSSPAVSHHLRLLKDGGLIVSTRKGKEMYYRAAGTDTSKVMHHAIDFMAHIHDLP